LAFNLPYICQTKRESKMKKIVITLILGVFVSGFVSAQKTKKSTTPAPVKVTEEKIEIVADGLPKIKFVEETHDFGNIKEGTQATYEFKFTNTGNAPLILESVQASCGCTTPEWSKDPIAPGQTGKVIATFNSSGRPGTFVKTITVKYNGAVESNTNYLTIKGSVDAAPVAPPTPVAVPDNH
jgi:hypothetical protein